MTERVDVAVIGLGALGSATLDQFAKRGVRVVGLDRDAPPHAMGSSYGEMRITRQAVGEGRDYVPFVVDSHRIWRELEAASGKHLFTQCGALVMGPGRRRDDPPRHAGLHGAVDRRRGAIWDCA